MAPPMPDALLELILDLVDPGLDAGLVLLAARAARCAGRTDHVVADLDRQRALARDHVRQGDEAELRVVLQPLHEIARGAAEGARGVGLAEAVIHGVRAGA